MESQLNIMHDTNQETTQGTTQDTIPDNLNTDINNFPEGFIPEGAYISDPINDTINDTINFPIDYVPDNSQWNPLTGSNRIPLHTSQRIEMLNMLLNDKQDVDKNIKEINKIHHDLLKINESFDYKEDTDNGEIRKHEESIIKNMKYFTSLMDEFKLQNNLLLDYEKDYKEYYDKSKEDVNKINDFKLFVNSINQKYNDLDVSELNETVLKMVQNINKDNKIKELNDKYIKQSYIVNLYIHKFIKQVNGCNIGNTCSLCLERPVDTFMEPCGHTGCSQCIEKLKERNNEYNCNCFLCRKRVMKFHKLYFT